MNLKQKQAQVEELKNNILLNSVQFKLDLESFINALYREYIALGKKYNTMMLSANERLEEPSFVNIASTTLVRMEQIESILNMFPKHMNNKN